MLRKKIYDAVYRELGAEKAVRDMTDALSPVTTGTGLSMIENCRIAYVSMANRITDAVMKEFDRERE